MQPNFRSIKINSLSRYKGFVKECPSLKLTRDKFESIYRMFFSSGSPNNFVDHVFASFDKDGDG